MEGHERPDMRIVSVVSLFLISTTLACGAVGPTASKPLFAAGFEQAAVSAGQAARFLAHSFAYTIAVESDGSATLRPVASSSDVRLQWVDSSRRAVPLARNPLPFSKNDYRGSDPAGWRTDIPLFQNVEFQEFYPGIRLSYRIDNGGLEYEFLVSAGANPGRIGMRVPPGWHAAIEESGDLKLTRQDEVLYHRRPVAYQGSGAQTVEVTANFQLDGGIVHLAMPDGYDPQQPLVLDPIVSFSGYLGGSAWDAAYGTAVDSSGNVYVTGDTASLDFPGALRAARSNRDVFVSKVKDGVVLYTTILGSSGNDSGAAIAVDGAGRAYVAGTAGASNFPVTLGAAQYLFGGAQDAFVARLDAAGHLDYLSFLGGGGADSATGIAVDSSGNAYIAGYTASANFPTVGNVPQGSYKGGFHDAFIAKFSSSGGQVLYATLLGGQGNDVGSAIAMDSAGNAVIAGYTDSPDFPVYQAFQPLPGGGGDAFVASLNASGTQWNFVTYLGGTAPDQATAIALDGAGNLYVAGSTYSPNFPVSAAPYQGTPRGNYDVFVSKLNPAGSLLLSTLLGGSGADAGTAIALDASGEVWVAGYTASFDFPTFWPLQASHHGSFEGFVAKLNSSLSALSFSTYWGGSLDDRVWAIAPAGLGRLAVAGYTSSIDFPTAGAMAVPGGGYNAFLLLLDKDPPPTAVSVTPASGSGSQQSFAFLVRDAGGYSRVGTVLMMIHSSFGFTGGCQFRYDAAASQFFLYDDARGWLGPITAGAPATLNNGRCVLNGSGTSASGSGSNLTVALSVSFLYTFSGNEKVYLCGQQGAYGGGGLHSGWQQVGTWTIPFVPAPKVTAVSVSPNSGSGNSGAFQFTVQDTNGFAAIGAVLMMINNPFAFSGGCQFRYDAAQARFYLYDDSKGWLGPITTNSGGIANNGRCLLYGNGTSASGSGLGLTVTLNVTFQFGFTGEQKTYLCGQEGVYGSPGLNSGWQQVGVWTIPATVQPTVAALSVSPNSGSGGSGAFQFIVQDSNGAAAVGTVLMMINNTFSYSGGCQFRYDQAANRFYLYDDTRGWLGPLVAGSAGSLNNTRCLLNGPGTAALINGSSVTVVLSVIFQAGFTGQQKTFLLAQEGAYGSPGLNSGWQEMGTWQIAL